jgi:hypothetical protein
MDCHATKAHDAWRAILLFVQICSASACFSTTHQVSVCALLAELPKFGDEAFEWLMPFTSIYVKLSIQKHGRLALCRVLQSRWAEFRSRVPSSHSGISIFDALVLSFLGCRL